MSLFDRIKEKIKLDAELVSRITQKSAFNADNLDDDQKILLGKIALFFVINLPVGFETDITIEGQIFNVRGKFNDITHRAMRDLCLDMARYLNSEIPGLDCISRREKGNLWPLCEVAEPKE